jgi:Type I phosphodiesterase / nucleotide pyrophosphatase
VTSSPLVSVFLDGLRPDWVQKMPFVRSLAAADSIRTEFGYSIACHASMYTGMSIQDHGLWFVWLRDLPNSPFNPWLERIPTALDQIPTRLVMRKILLQQIPAEAYPRGYFRVPRLINVPMRHWPGLWVSEEKFWDEDQYVSKPTIFELARRSGLSLKTLGFHRGDQLASVQQPLLDSDLCHDWYYIFMGAVDHAAHRTGGEGRHFDEVIVEVDRAIEARCAQIERAHGTFDLVLWSDHGHLKVTKPVDIYDRMDKRVMDSTPHIVDTNFARFWVDGDSKQRLISMLENTLPEGHVLTQDEMEGYECWFPDGRYGDIIFYLDAPAAFTRTAWGFSRSQKSIHGYLPDNESMSATFVSTLESPSTNSIRDIFHLHKSRLGLD